MTLHFPMNSSKFIALNAMKKLNTRDKMYTLELPSLACGQTNPQVQTQDSRAQQATFSCSRISFGKNPALGRRVANPELVKVISERSQMFYCHECLPCFPVSCSKWANISVDTVSTHGVSPKYPPCCLTNYSGEQWFVMKLSLCSYVLCSSSQSVDLHQFLLCV